MELSNINKQLKKKTMIVMDMIIKVRMKMMNFKIMIMRGINSREIKLDWLLKKFKILNKL